MDGDVDDVSNDDAVLHAQLIASLGADGVRLGSGGEATVYTLDAHRVLRIFRGDPGDGGAELADVYRRWATDSRTTQLGFALPTVLDDGFTHDLHWQILRRIPGTEVGKLLRVAPADRRHELLTAYLHGSTKVGDIDTAATYGTLLGGDTYPTWANCLRARLLVPSRELRDQLADSVPGFTDTVARFDAAIDHLYDGPARLVHVDYFPGNVMAADSPADSHADGYRVTGVLDFASHSVFGDPLLDITGAVLMADMGTDVTSAEQSALAREAAKLVGGRFADVLETYRVFYALYYAMDENLLPWSARHLTAVHEGRGLLG